MKAYIITNGKYIFDFEADKYTDAVTEKCILPSRKLAEIILDNAFNSKGEVKEIEYIHVDDRRKAYHEGYSQGKFDEQMHRNYE